jgi:glycosyltransferase involved in cell wall biosynthesis
VPTSPIFSVAIPAYNEARLLPRLLDSIDVARARYGDDPQAIEVIVGNNSSTDATAEIARARGCTVVDVEKRAIAAARNGAAGAARGEILCFIDADSILHPETFNEIEEVMKAGRCAVGASGVWMERMSAGIAATWLVMVPATRLLGVDTGVVFCRRGDFAAVGGYREQLMVAEDVDFMWRLKRHGRKRGARFQRLPTARAITSTRKFDCHGDWHYLTMLLKLPFKLLRSRNAARELAWSYWYEARSAGEGSKEQGERN